MALDKLQEEASKIGLRAVGVAPAIDEAREVFPWARSVISCAVSYLPPEEEPVTPVADPVILNGAKNPGAGKQIPRAARNDCGGAARNDEDDALRGLVARFARGRDYHEVLRGKLNALARSLSGRWEVCVDTTPIPERKLAVLAGIAWRGWNSNVFVEGCGSWVSLGEIVTELDLPVSRPLDIDRCADCARCMRHCPTGAIVEPYVVDRTRCLSAITQMPGEIPGEFKAKLANRIHGCDTCQEVCPRNSGVKPVTPEFAERRFPGAYPELIPLIEMTAREFRERVKPSSIGWMGRRRIQRNAAIAAENLGHRH